MRNIIVLLIVVLAILVSCKPEPETTLTLEFSNASSANIIVKKYIGQDSLTLMNLSSDHQWVSPTFSDMGGDVPSLFQYSFTADSLVVVFSDSLKIIHIPYNEGSQSTAQFDGKPEIIWRNQPRSLRNLDSYTLEDRGDDRNQKVIARYTFTEEDLEYAISVYE